MKVSEVVEQLDEYRKIEKLVNEITMVIEKLDGPTERKEFVAGGYITGVIVVHNTEHEEVRLSMELSNLIRNNLKVVLSDHYDALTSLQNGLEI